jgi:hypothetical protein
MQLLLLASAFFAPRTIISERTPLRPLRDGGKSRLYVAAARGSSITRKHPVRMRGKSCILDQLHPRNKN